MSILVGKNFFNNKKLELVVSIAKIVIIIFVGMSFIANFGPFYEEGSNSYFYGVASVKLSEGNFEITNNLLLETGQIEFTAQNWLKTVDNTSIPVSGHGLMLIGALFYAIGGYYGLFYLSPIFGIVLLILSERIATNLFNKYVGLLTLIFLATSNLIFRNTERLQTETLFSVVILLGIFYLIKFVQTKKYHKLITSSSLLAFAVIIRPAGFIFFPVELFLLGGIFVLSSLGKKFPKSLVQGNLNWCKNKKIGTKIIIILLLPWIIVISYQILYNENYFGEPFTNHLEQLKEYHYENSFTDMLTFEKKDVENIKEYSKYLLPYQLPAVYNKVDNNFDNVLGKDWLGIIALIVLSFAVFISYYSKEKRFIISSFFILIIANLCFYSLITTESRAEFGVPARYMIPVNAMSFMLISFLITKFITFQSLKTKLHNVKNYLKIISIVFLVIFSLGGFYFSNPVQIILDDGFKFKNPEIYASRYPLNQDGLSSTSVILATNANYALDYNVIPFRLDMPSQWNQEKFDLLTKIMDDGYDVFVFKEPTHSSEKDRLRFLINEYGVVLTEYSDELCKISLEISKTSDKVCIEND